VAYGLGLAYDDGPIVLVVLAHEDSAAADRNADALRQLYERGLSSAGRSWDDDVRLDSLETNAGLVVARFIPTRLTPLAPPGQVFPAWQAIVPPSGIHECSCERRAVRSASLVPVVCPSDGPPDGRSAPQPHAPTSSNRATARSKSCAPRASKHTGCHAHLGRGLSTQIGFGSTDHLGRQTMTETKSSLDRRRSCRARSGPCRRR
jgi:hypothetical protein